MSAPLLDRRTPTRGIPLGTALAIIAGAGAGGLAVGILTAIHLIQNGLI